MKKILLPLGSVLMMTLASCANGANLKFDGIKHDLDNGAVINVSLVRNGGNSSFYNYEETNKIYHYDEEDTDLLLGYETETLKVSHSYYGLDDGTIKLITKSDYDYVDTSKEEEVTKKYVEHNERIFYLVDSIKVQPKDQSTTYEKTISGLVTVSPHSIIDEVQYYQYVYTSAVTEYKKFTYDKTVMTVETKKMDCQNQLAVLVSTASSPYLGKELFEFKNGQLVKLDDYASAFDTTKPLSTKSEKLPIATKSNPYAI